MFFSRLFMKLQASQMNLDKNSQVPLYKQLGEIIIKKINAGEYLPNTRMPAIRTIATEYNINNSTVVGAYKYLEKKQMVYSIMGSGTYVAMQKEMPKVILKDIPMSQQRYINFADTSLDPAFFPKNDLKKSFEAVIERDGAKAFSFTDTSGYTPLCETISQMEKKENVQIISDISQGIEIILDTFISPGDAVIVESPTSLAIVAALLQKGAKVLEVPVTEDGLDLDKLFYFTKKYKPKLFFLMPNFQTPTNICYTEKTKIYILQLANKFNAYIIEIDNYNDFFYSKKPQTLLAMDNDDRVLYIKSFERIISAGLLGYIIYPKGVKFFAGGASGYIQRGLDFYFKNFDYDNHCKNIRTAYAQRYKKAVAVTETFLSPFCTVFAKSEGGLCLWLKLKKELADCFPVDKVLVSLGQLYFRYEQMQYFRISYANVSLDDISKGIGILASVLTGKQKG